MNKLPKIKFQFKNPFKNWSKKKKILVSVIAVVTIGIIAVFISFNQKKSQMKENRAANFTTETAKIQRQTLTNSISATGTVESAETKTVNTRMTNMEVLSVYVKEGDYVEEGTVICEFDSSDYEEELAKAKNNHSVNEKIDALGDDYTTTYNEAIAKAEDGLTDVRATRDEAKEAYIEAMDELADEESDVASAKNTYEEYLAKYPNAESDLKKSQSECDAAQATIAALEQATDALTVPYDAVTTTPDGKSTITVEIDGEKKTISVETGLETDYYTEIISDEISEGMTVVLSTPMMVTTPESDEEMGFPGGIGNLMPGGDMPDRGGNREGGMPSGGMPDRGGMPSGGGPGGF